MNYTPTARIIIRYVVGVVIGADAESIMELNPDLITFVATGIGLVVEAFYAYAKRKGWPT